jgi:hypothetical protein
MNFSTQEAAWQNISFNLLGRKLTGVKGFEVKKSIEKEHVYGAGSEPLDIQEGNKKYEGSLKILKYELDLLNDAAQAAGFEDITEVPHTLINCTVQFKKLLTDKTRFISVVGIAFTEMPTGMDQNAKMMEITLPFLAMKSTLLFKAPGS